MEMEEAYLAALEAIGGAQTKGVTYADQLSEWQHTFALYPSGVPKWACARRGQLKEPANAAYRENLATVVLSTMTEPTMSPRALDELLEMNCSGFTELDERYQPRDVRACDVAAWLDRAQARRPSSKLTHAVGALRVVDLAARVRSNSAPRVLAEGIGVVLLVNGDSGLLVGWVPSVHPRSGFYLLETLWMELQQGPYAKD